MVDSSDLLKFVRDELLMANPSIDVETIMIDTDLVAYGIESIQLLQLIVKIEQKFAVSLSLEKLANNCFKFSVNTLLGYLD